MMAMTAPLTVEDAIELAEGSDRSDLAVKDLDVLATEARWHKEQVAEYHRLTLHHCVEMGRRLIEAKKRMPQPEFVIWATQSVGVRRAEAYNYMQLARPENVQRVGQLAPETSLRGALETIQEQRREDRQPTVRPAWQPSALPNTIHLEVGDAADLPLPEDLVDLIVTSPPYGLGVNYSHADDDEGYSTYVEHAAIWAEEMLRVAAPQGRLCLNVPLDVSRNGRKAMYSDWLRILQAVGWQYETTIVWNKDNINDTTARGSLDSPSATHVVARVEMIAVLYKGEWNLNRIAPSDLSTDEGHQNWLDWTSGLWTFPGETRRIVLDVCPVPFPEELPRRLIQLYSFPDAVILDPFLGSGTTAVVGAQLGRSVYGFDKSDRSIDFAQERVDLALHQS